MVPSVAVTVKVVLPVGVFKGDSLGFDPEPHPEMPRPTASIKPASHIPLILFHFLRVANNRAQRIPMGSSRPAPLGVSVRMTRKIDATGAAAVSDCGLGTNAQLVYKGRFAQLNVTLPVYPPVPVRVTSVFTL